MSKVFFKHKGNNIMIQCEQNEKVSEILKKYAAKGQIDITKVYFLYNGSNIKDDINENEELKLEELINNNDKERNEMTILVNDINNESANVNDNKNIVKSKEIICPDCKESIFIDIDDLKFNLNHCKNGHKFKNISLNEFENTQNIDISKIKCNLCDINKSNSYNNELFLCLNCNINLCPLCRSKHDKEHKIIDYELRNYICNKHYQSYIKYCKACKKDICVDCEEDHKNHEDIYYGNIVPKGNLQNILADFKQNIDKFNNEINNIINNLKTIMNNITNYYNISSHIINNYNSQYKNYIILNNINDFIKYNNTIENDIKRIINSDIINKFKSINNLYHNYKNNNYIKAEIKIEEEDLNKKIQIINHSKDSKEIEENCVIKINNEIIPFSYTKEFSKKGPYIIKYYFSKNLSSAEYLFHDCKKLTNLDLSNFNTKDINNMSHMFYECSSLKYLDISDIDTKSVTNMRCMFCECSSLKELNLSNFNTNKVTDMSYMFYNCSSLINLNLGNLDNNSVNNIDSMFSDCVESIILTNFNTCN